MRSRRDEILEKSFRLFAQRGFEGVSMRDIAQAVDISVSSLYGHFPGKESLYLAVLDRCVTDRVMAVLQQVDDGLPPVEQIRRACKRLVAFLNENPEVAQLVLWVSLDRGDERKAFIVEKIWRRKFAWFYERFIQLTADEAHALALSFQLFGLIFSEFAMRDCVVYLPEARQLNVSVAAEEVAARIWTAIAAQLPREGGV